jgi:hypothetical protein
MDKMAKISLDDKIALGETCEARYCEDKQTTEKAANYGLCDYHYKTLDWECEKCGAKEYHWCSHR